MGAVKVLEISADFQKTCSYELFSEVLTGVGDRGWMYSTFLLIKHEVLIFIGRWKKTESFMKKWA